LKITRRVEGYDCPMAPAHRTHGGAHADVANIRAYVRPYSHHHRYHAYYREGLRAAASEFGVGFEVTSMTRLPKLLGRLRRLQDRGYHFKVPRAATALGRGFDAVGRALEGQVRLPSPSFDPRIGQFLVTLADGSSRRVCIDSMDPPELSSPELAAWSDVTFKTNFWPTVEYPANVRPLVNGDPTVLDRIPALRAARATPKDYDLCCIMRVWGGREGLEGIEHNLRLLEAVQRTRAAKVLLAVLIVGDRSDLARRLERFRIPSTTRSVSPEELWRLTASSRLNILRLGVHDCIPWRVTGSLGLGSCLVLDQPPRAQWPEPLLPDVNYLSLGLDTTTGGGVAREEAYAAVPDLLESWLATTELLDMVARTNATYFDDHVAPARVGAHILEEVARTGAREAAG
jgi:hypothetical protein